LKISSAWALSYSQFIASLHGGHGTYLGSIGHQRSGVSTKQSALWIFSINIRHSKNSHS